MDARKYIAKGTKYLAVGLIGITGAFYTPRANASLLEEIGSRVVNVVKESVEAVANVPIRVIEGTYNDIRDADNVFEVIGAPVENIARAGVDTVESGLYDIPQAALIGEGTERKPGELGEINKCIEEHPGARAVRNIGTAYGVAHAIAAAEGGSGASAVHANQAGVWTAGAQAAAEVGRAAK